MRLINDGTHEIGYSDFCYLLNEEGWEISVKMKDNWDGERHKQYILSLLEHKSNHIVRLIVDNEKLTKVNRINVYISPANIEIESTSSTKFIQFVKQNKK